MADYSINESTVPKDQRTQAKSEQEQVTRIRTQWMAWLEASQEFRQEAQESFEMGYGGKRAWRSDDAASLTKEKRPVQSFNIMFPTLNFLAGYQAEREQDYRAFPKGLDDEAIARMTSQFLKHAMDVAEGAHHQHLQFRKGATCGLSVLEVGHRYEYSDDFVEGDAYLDVLPQNAWGCDPGARRYDRADSYWQTKLLWMPREQAQRRWPKSAQVFSLSGLFDAAESDPRLTGIPAQLRTEFYQRDTGQIRLFEHWYKVPVNIILLTDTQSQDLIKFTKETDAEKFLQRVRDLGGQAMASRFRVTETGTLAGVQNVETGEMQPYATVEEADQALATIKQQGGAAAVAKYELLKRDATAMKVCHLTAWDWLDDGPAPDPHDWRYPFSCFIPYQDADDLYMMKGIFQDLKDCQREINWNHSTMQDELVRGPKSGWWMPKDMEAQLEELKNRVHRSGFIGFYNTAPPQPINPQPISEGFMRLLLFDLEFAQRTSSINAELVGQTTQKTVSGRAIQARQSGGLVGLASLMLNWKRTRLQQGLLLLKTIQRTWSPQKMLRVLGETQAQELQMGMQPGVMPTEQLIETFKRLKTLDFDIKVDFQEASATARQAVFTRMVQLKAMGVPYPLDLLVDAGDVPYKEEVKAILKRQGPEPMNPEMAKILGASQGQGPQPDGVNATQ